MQHKVIIMGGGVSGLVAAIELQKRNVDFILLEKSAFVGGRVKSEYEDGFIYDHGFQVLQTAYPEAKLYLDYQKLALKAFKPGARVFKDGFFSTISDPFRDLSALFETIFSPIATLNDKLLILKLRNEVKKLDINSLFGRNQISTLEFLKQYGFSAEIITHFFQPFFAGIYLEQQLSTSCDAFQFIYKMFTEGEAAVPAKGMGEITHQLEAQIESTRLITRKEIKQISGNEVKTADGETYTAQAILVATGAQTFESFTKPETWNATDCIYFEAPKSIVEQPYLVLNSLPNRLINHIAFLSDIAPEYASKGRRLISVNLAEASEKTNIELQPLVTAELEQLFGTKGFKWLKRFNIPFALPNKNSIEVSPIKRGESVFVAGDTRYFGSLNFAMKSGREAAEAIAKALS